MSAASFYAKLLDIARGIFPQSGVVIGASPLKWFPCKLNAALVIDRDLCKILCKHWNSGSVFFCQK